MLRYVLYTRPKKKYACEEGITPRFSVRVLPSLPTICLLLSNPISEYLTFKPFPSINHPLFNSFFFYFPLKHRGENAGYVVSKWNIHGSAGKQGGGEGGTHMLQDSYLETTWTVFSLPRRFASGKYPSTPSFILYILLPFPTFYLFSPLHLSQTPNAPPSLCPGILTCQTGIRGGQKPWRKYEKDTNVFGVVCTGGINS